MTLHLDATKIERVTVSDNYGGPAYVHYQINGVEFQIGFSDSQGTRTRRTRRDVYAKKLIAMAKSCNPDFVEVP